MARLGKNTRFTVFDVLEEKGLFQGNPANSFATGKNNESIYKGPVEFPKMLYEPQGKEEIYEPAREEEVRGRNITIPAKLRLISKIVVDQAEQDYWLAKGWHEHPADAIFVRTGERPPVGISEKAKELSIENKHLAETNAELTRQKAELEEQIARLTAAAVVEPFKPAPVHLAKANKPPIEI